MHSGLLHYWTPVWLFSFSAAIKTDDSHFEASAAGRRGRKKGKKRKERRTKAVFFQREEDSVEARAAAPLEHVAVIMSLGEGDAQSDCDKGVIIPLCVDVSTK